jgi:hypothetical protein
VDCVVNEFLAVVELFVIVAAPTRAIANLPSWMLELLEYQRDMQKKRSFAMV